MHKALIGFLVLAGVAFTATSEAAVFGAAPRAAAFVGGVYTCPYGWQLVTYPVSQTVSYQVQTGWTLQPGFFGRRLRYVPQYTTYTNVIPANVQYCVFTGAPVLLPGVPVYPR